MGGQHSARNEYTIIRIVITKKTVKWSQLYDIKAGTFTKPPLATVLHATGLSICSSVCRQNAKNAIFSKTKQFTAMVSIDDL